LEDYLAAEKQVTDATQFATAAAFIPDHWTRPTSEAGWANFRLLEAEHLPKGDGRKADFVSDAVRFWDGDLGEQAIQAACALAQQFFGVQVESAEVRRRVGQALCQVVEHVIADFGDAMGRSELELFNTLDACRRLPEPRGVTAAGGVVVAKQLQVIDRYLSEALRVVTTPALSGPGGLSEVELQRLLGHFREARDAFGLLRVRPSLLHKLPESRFPQFATLSIELALAWGWYRSRWQVAAELAADIRPEHLLPQLPPERRHIVRFACYAMPLMARAAQGQDVIQDLEGLKRSFPLIMGNIEEFKRRARALFEGRPPVAPSRPVGPPKPKPDQTVQTIAGVVLFFFFLIGAGGRACYHANPPAYHPSGRPAPFLGQNPPPALPPPNYAPAPLGPLPTEAIGLERAALVAKHDDARRLQEQAERLLKELVLDRVVLDTSSTLAVVAYNTKVLALRRAAQTAQAAADSYNAAVQLRQQSRANHEP